MGSLVAVTPAHALDTRYGTGAPKGPAAAHSKIRLHINGIAGVPSTGVGAVSLVLSVASPTQNGYLSVYPDGGAPPGLASLDYNANTPIATTVLTKVATNGYIDIVNNSTGTTHIIATITGYTVSGTPTAAGAFGALTPAHALDTRYGTGAPKGPAAAHSKIRLHINGIAGVPSTGVGAVSLVLSVASPTQNGYLSVYPDGGAPPGLASLDYNANTPIATTVLTKVATNGYIDIVNNSTGTTHIIATITGYTVSGTPTAAGAFGALTPAHALDTRYGTGAPKGPAAAHSKIRLHINGIAGVPSTGVGAVSLVLSVASPTQNGYLSVYPDGGAPPGLASLDYNANTPIATTVLTKVATNGYIDIVNNSTGTTHIIATITGYTAPSAGQGIATQAPLPANATSSPDASLTSIVCPAAQSCTAIGNYFATNDVGRQVLLETSAAGQWTAVQGPLPANADTSDNAQVVSVSCSAPGACVAVGHYVNLSGQSQGLIETLANGVWTAKQAPTPANTDTTRDITLTSVVLRPRGHLHRRRQLLRQDATADSNS